LQPFGGVARLFGNSGLRIAKEAKAMRSFIVMAMFVASLSSAAWNGFTEDRNPGLDTQDINALEIHVGAGELDIKGVAGIHNIQVKAISTAPDVSDNKAREVIVYGSGSLVAADVHGTIHQDN
jgi:hypothetical protein